jgi:hypothetical protein
MWDMISMILSTWNVMRIEDATNNNWKTFYEPFINKIWWLDAKLEFVKCQNEWIDTTKKKKKKLWGKEYWITKSNMEHKS